MTRKTPTKNVSKSASKPTSRHASALAGKAASAPPKARKLKKATPLPPITATAAKGTKISKFLELLRTDQGVTIDEAAQALHWQRHTVRGVMSGVIRKRLHLDLERLPGEGPTHYRLPKVSS